MVFYILISIVFIAEIIIALTVILNLIKVDKFCNDMNNLLTEINPKIKDICQISRKISEQMLEFSPIIAENIKTFFINLLKDQLKSMLAGLTFWVVKNEVSKRV